MSDSLERFTSERFHMSDWELTPHQTEATERAIELTRRGIAAGLDPDLLVIERKSESASAEQPHRSPRVADSAEHRTATPPQNRSSAWLGRFALRR